MIVPLETGDSNRGDLVLRMKGIRYSPYFCVCGGGEGVVGMWGRVR